MRLVFNLRDAKARDWDGFWKISQDPNAKIERFGFVMGIISIEQDAWRIEQTCKDRMKWVRATLRAEDLATMRKNYATVRDCKSHRAIGNAERTLARTDRIVGELVRFVNEMMN